jgi:hypothetical protein
MLLSLTCTRNTKIDGCTRLQRKPIEVAGYRQGNEIELRWSNEEELRESIQARRNLFTERSF